MKPILEVHNIWKKYKIGGQKERYLNFRDKITNALKFKTKKEDFWALQDISFQAFEGDSMAIIGRNGAGKSTMLKILSKITPPTRGQIKIKGRIASLLEVGTGFHPELTGRENIYLNGAILGLRKIEINQKLDQIIDFSGVEKFLDTPLKHYSSGMKLRLAFSVAAYLEPEILLIDEVLAVGDTEFQKKCIGRMDEVSKEGRTVIFVSHDLEAVRKLCKTGIVLDHGQIIDTGEISSVVNNYLVSFSKITNESIKDMIGEKVLNEFIIEALQINWKGKQMEIKLELSGNDLTKISSVIYHVYGLSAQRISLLDLRNDVLGATKNNRNNKIEIVTKVDFSNYVEGMYSISLGMQKMGGEWYESAKLGFELLNLENNIDQYASKYRGYFEVKHSSQTRIL